MTWLFAVSHEVLGLRHILWEVLEEDSGLGLDTKSLDEAEYYGFIVGVCEAVGLHELIEINQGHIGPFGELHTDLGLSGSFGSDHKHGLGHQSELGGSIDFADSSSGVNSPDLAQLSIIVNNRHRLVKELLDSIFDRDFIVVGSSAGLGALHASLNHDLLLNIIKQTSLTLKDILLEVFRLIESSWEAVDQVGFGLLLKHGVDQKGHSKLVWDELAICNNLLDLFSFLRTL